jgi:hypothetical protein
MAAAGRCFTCLFPFASPYLRRNDVLQVKRRFREFEALHATLNALSVRPDLPPLPGKKFFGSLET